jgi:hypothetical protein
MRIGPGCVPRWAVPALAAYLVMRRDRPCLRRLDEASVAVTARACGRLLIAATATLCALTRSFVG